jgi:amidase
VTFFGRAWAEGRLIALAYDYEQQTRHRRAPSTTPPLVARRAR